VRNEQAELVGYFGYGTSALIWGSEQASLYIEDHVIAVGLGMRPELTGQGLGLAFVQAGLDFARQQFAPKAFRLYVFPWNQRAIKVYQKAGFQTVGTRKGQEGVFLEMSMPA
jgi:RimJ/RimL family protein N-acetyltransferase